MNVDKDTRKTINKWLASIPAFENTMDKLISLVDEYGTEIIAWTVKTQMKTLYNDALLQAKEIYNLWVLNWPDIDIMMDVIPNPTGWRAKFSQLFWAGISYREALRNSKGSVQWVAESNARLLWLGKPETPAKTVDKTVDKQVPEQMQLEQADEQAYLDIIS